MVSSEYCHCQIFYDYVQPPVQVEKVSKMSYLYTVVCAVLLNYSVKDLKNNTNNNEENPLFKLESLLEF